MNLFCVGDIIAIMIKNNYYRLWQLFLFTMSLFIMLASLYFQFIQHLQPCSLCIMQRICIMFVLIISLISACLGQIRASYGLIICQFIVITAGLYFASRQLWLQSLSPEQMPACLPGLDILIRYFPWRDIMHALFLGTTDCGNVSWQLLGLSMAAWSALCFLALFVGIWIAYYLLRKTCDQTSLSS